MATHSSILPKKSHRQKSLEGYSPWGHKRDRHDRVTKKPQLCYMHLSIKLYKCTVCLILVLQYQISNSN